MVRPEIFPGALTLPKFAGSMCGPSFMGDFNTTQHHMTFCKNTRLVGVEINNTASVGFAAEENGAVQGLIAGYGHGYVE